MSAIILFLGGCAVGALVAYLLCIVAVRADCAECQKRLTLSHDTDIAYATDWRELQAIMDNQPRPRG
jgi:hypothetical protein